MNGQCFLPFAPGIEVRLPNYVFSPSIDHVVDDSPNLNLSDVRGIPIPAPLDQAPHPNVPHLRVISDSPTITSPQYAPSTSFPPNSSHRLASTRSLPSYPEHARPAYPQHGHSLSDDYSRSSIWHSHSASSSPYRSATQLPHVDQTYLRYQDRSLHGLQVSPQLPPSSLQDPHSTLPQLEKFAQTSARYECTYCGKTFNRPSSLKTHTNTHTGEKRTLCRSNWRFAGSQQIPLAFVCPHSGCGRAFSVQSNMRRHARVHDTSHTEGGDSSPDDGIEDPPSSR